MFSLINTFLLVIILFRLFKYDKFYVIKNNFRIQEDKSEVKQFEKRNKNNKNNNTNV